MWVFGWDAWMLAQVDQALPHSELVWVNIFIWSGWWSAQECYEPRYGMGPHKIFCWCNLHPFNENPTDFAVDVTVIKFETKIAILTRSWTESKSRTCSHKTIFPASLGRMMRASKLSAEVAPTVTYMYVSSKARDCCSAEWERGVGRGGSFMHQSGSDLASNWRPQSSTDKRSIIITYRLEQ